MSSERRINISAPSIDKDAAMQAFQEILESGQMASGSRVKLAEEAMAHAFAADHGVLVSNGTVSLRTGLVAGLAAREDVGMAHVDRYLTGKEVIIPAYSFNATLNSVLQTGATAHAVDIRPDDFGMDITAMNEARNGNTVAVMPVDLYGQAAGIRRDDDAVKDLFIIRDAAQSHGAELDDSPIINNGDVVSTSFYPTKNVAGFGEGGGIVTDSEEIARVARIYRNQGMSAPYVYDMVGDNLRLTELQGAVIEVGLRGLVVANQRRRENAALLSAGLSDIRGITTPETLPGRTHVWHQYTVLVDQDEFGIDRGALQRALNEHGIGSGVYYPKTMTDHPSYENHPRIIKDPTPVADRIAQQVLSLPVHPGVSAEDIERIVETIKLIQKEGA
ncbi:MAG: DegT/DnrJ/EryC1/StrS family aminotransferase [Candidatus Saccharimonas sp.]